MSRRTGKPSAAGASGATPTTTSSSTGDSPASAPRFATKDGSYVIRNGDFVPLSASKDAG